MKKSDARRQLPEHAREVVYSTIGKGIRSGQSLDFVSRSVKFVLGYRQSEFLEDPNLWKSLVHPDDLGKFEKKRRSTIRSGKGATLAYRMKIKKGGSYIWVEDKFKARHNGDGKVVGIEGSVVDITERKQLEDALHQSETHLHSIFDEAAIGMYRTTSDGRILMANKFLIDMLEYDSFEDLSTRNLNETGYGDGHPRSDFQKQIERDGTVRGFEAVWLGKNGKRIYARESAHVVCDCKGNVMYYEGTVEDISDRKKAEERTTRINQVLRVVSSVGQAIIHESSEDELLQKACRTIVAEGEYRMVWIGVLDEETKRVKPLAWAGAEEGYLRKVLVTADDRPESKGPVGRAIKSGEPCVCNDVETDPDLEVWRTDALKRGFNSIGGFPMRVRDTVVGSLNVYSTAKEHFTPEETHLLSELADDIGFAIWAIEARNQQEAADEVIRDRDFWLEESQRVAKVGSYIYELKSRSWSSTAVLDELLGIDSSYKRNFKSWLSLIHPEDRADLISEFQECLSLKERFTTEFRIVRPNDGKIRWMWGTAEVRSDDSGVPARLFGTLQDLTERRQIEKQLQNERILLRTLVDNLPTSIYIKDLNYRKILSNPTNVRHAWKKSEAEVIGKTDFELYPKELADQFYEDDKNVIEHGKSVIDREEFTLGEDGEKLWQVTSKIPLRDEKGKIVGLIGIGTDITARKRAEEEKQQERTLLKAILDHLPASVWVKDIDYKRTLVNKAHVARTGLFAGKDRLTESDFLGKTDSDVYGKERGEEFLDEDRMVIRDGEAVLNREELVFDSKGAKHWQLVSKVPLFDGDGKVTGLVGIVTDVTKQKEAEEENVRARELLKTIINHIPNGIFVKDEQLRKILVNPAHIERVSMHIGPRKEEDLIGKTDFDVYPPGVAEEYMVEDERILRDGKTILNKPLSSTNTDGQTHWELISKIPMRDENGKITGMVGVSTDITAVREAEERLAENEARFRLLAENARDLVFRYSAVPQPHFEYVSPSAVEINGYTPEEHYADPELIVKVIHPDEHMSLKGLVERLEASEEPMTMRWIRKDGAVIWVEIQSRVIYDARKNIVAVEGIVRDITDRKESEEALRASQETLARITSSITDVIYSVDGATGEFEYLSPVFEKILGYSIDDIKRMGGRWKFLMSVIEGEDPSKPDPVLNEMQQRRVETMPVWERWWKRKDGSKRFMEDYAVPLYEGDRLVRVDGVLRDITDRKLAEEEVERERILLRTLIDNFPYSIYVKDKNYRKIIANYIDYKEFAGFSSESEIIGKTDFDIYPKDVAERLVADDRKVILEGQAVMDREEPIVDSRGKEHWLRTTKIPLRDNENNVIGLVGVGIDVTEKRAVDEALRRSEAELRALFESMNDVIMVMNAEGRYLKIAPTDPSLLHRPAEELVGKTLFDALPERQAEQFLSVILETLRDRKTHTVEYSIEIGGEEKWRAANVSPMTEDSVIWVARDVTERKAMEKEIVDSEKKYRELVENALVGIFKVNLSGTIVYVNKAMADMLEFDSPQDMMSVSSSALYKNIEDMSSLIEELRKFGKTGKNKELEMVTKSGKVRNVLISASLDQDVISGMAKDITEIRTLERQFIQTQKLEGLGNIAAGIAHDFNNILGVILGYSDLLGDSSYQPDKFKRGMQAIAKSADRGKSLVRQLLTFARKTEVTFESLNLNNAVAEIEKLMVETFPRTIETRTDLEVELPPVLADASQIHQVLLNLCVNARDAMPKGGVLSISTDVVPGASLAELHPSATSDEYAEVRIADTGIGMDESTRQKIFEPFFTTKGIGRGTGLGLSVVYGIVESHRGFIDVESELGKGTTFRIYLPVLLHPIDDVDLRGGVPDTESGRTGTILVVEDEDMLRELLRSVLTSKGHDVLLAADGEEGVDMFMKNKDRVDIVISDLGLPKLSGEEVVSRIKKISRQAKIAVASGFIAPEVKAELDRAGVNHFVQKPYRAAEVLRTVSELLA